MREFNEALFKTKVLYLIIPTKDQEPISKNATTLTGYHTGMQASREIYQNSMTDLTDKEFKECNEQLPLEDQ